MADAACFFSSDHLAHDWRWVLEKRLLLLLPSLLFLLCARL
jgi:hypothetical protein